MPRLQLHALPMDDADADFDRLLTWGRPASARRSHAGQRDERRQARAWDHDEDRRAQRRELKLRSLHHGR